jgi:flagellar basal-body rod protein FlgF
MTSINAITLNALANDQARIERVATNLANVQTPGYKRELWVERSAPASGFAQAMAAVPQDSAGGLTEVSPMWPASAATLVRDMRPATLRPTGRALDVALAGAGLFEVATDQGPAYTRRGELQVDARGRLVTMQGHAVLGQGGEITVGGAGAGGLRIEADGRVFEGDRLVAQLRIVEAQADQLRALGGGLYTAESGVRELPANQVMVRQGFLENANVDTAHEMVGLTTSVRHFEAMLRVAQGRDEMLGSAIRKLGEV